ncbi:MAG: DNA cytosine methyltransferase, partial [Treponema sp.]|nr:DNA cytosine methyltransferase [Treponema sp.]
MTFSFDDGILSYMNGGKRFTYIDLFAGIGGFHQAANALGGECVFSSEIDAEAKRAYEANYKLKPHGDITQIDASKIPD